VTLQEVGQLKAAHEERFTRALFELLLEESGVLSPLLLGDGTIVHHSHVNDEQLTLDDALLIAQAWIRFDLHVERLEHKPCRIGLKVLERLTGHSPIRVKRLYGKKRDSLQDWVSDDNLLAAGELVRDRLRNLRLITTEGVG
jgi:hypothetical protein